MLSDFCIVPARTKFDSHEMPGLSGRFEFSSESPCRSLISRRFGQWGRSLHSQFVFQRTWTLSLIDILHEIFWTGNKCFDAYSSRLLFEMKICCYAVSILAQNTNCHWLIVVPCENNQIDNNSISINVSYYCSYVALFE